MGLETHSIVEIKERFHKEGRDLPYMKWEYGTLWIDTNDKEDIDTIKDVMETEVLCKDFKTSFNCLKATKTVLCKDFKTSFNCLKATKTEPWDQWAMDIVEIRG